MSIKDFDLIEINEAFSCQVLYSGRMLDLMLMTGQKRISRVALSPLVIPWG